MENLKVICNGVTYVCITEEHFEHYQQLCRIVSQACDLVKSPVSRGAEGVSGVSPTLHTPEDKKGATARPTGRDFTSHEADSVRELDRYRSREKYVFSREDN